MPIQLSEHLGIDPAKMEEAGVFDGFIDLDSRLHIDPHLLSESAAPEMQDARDALSSFFDDTIALLETCDSKSGPIYNAAYQRLIMPELKGVSLGFSRAEGDGSGIGPEIARLLASRAFDVVKAGERNPRIFELVGLFTDDYGADRISDVVLHVCLEHFARYTARIATELGLPTTVTRVRGRPFALPTRSIKGVLRPLYLVPKDVLRELPVALDRSELKAVGLYNRQMRAALNDLFATVGRGRKPDKHTLWDRVRADPRLLTELVVAYLNAQGAPYDFQTDPAAEFGRFISARRLAAEHPLDLAVPDGGWTADSALRAVLDLCRHFKKLVEVNGLWDAFWVTKGVKAKSLSERAMQRIFFGIALTYMRGNKPDLDISPETNAGRGPVDFKFSHGAAAKVTVEMKKSNHGKLLHGYETQLRLYNAAEATSASVFLIVRVSDDAEKIDAVTAARNAAIERGEKAPEVVIADARPQASASKA